MSIRLRALVVLAVALWPSGCGYVTSVLRARAPEPVAQRPVALIAEGTAFTPEVRAETRRVLEGALERPVQVLAALPSTTDAETKALAARLLGAHAAVAHYDWREPQCASDRVVLAGVVGGVDAVYRATLAYSERERPATDDEWEEMAWRRVGLRRLRQRPMLLEEVLAGSLERMTFVARDGTARASVHRSLVRRVGDVRRLDVARVVAEVAAGLGAVPAPAWDAVGQRLAKAGCPFLALGIAETQLAGRPEGEAVQATALGAMRASLERRSARLRSDEIAERARAALREGDLDQAAAMLAEYQSSPGRKPATTRELEETLAAARGVPAEAPPDVSSCHALCEMHMVEICNGDKVLWSAHRARWEATRCGTRREEAFLAECYREQWDTGTFETSCVQPCESSEEGRARLEAILQDAGCVTTSGPS